MRKPDSLRSWLTACLPALAGHPDQLQVYVEAGRIAARKSRTLSFEYRYTLQILLCDHVGNADDVIVPLLAWIEKEQPELFSQDDNEPFTYEAEILDGDRVDLLISLDLTEPVLVNPRADGSGYDIEHPTQPDFTDEFPGVGASWLRQCYAGMETVQESSDPAAALTPEIPPDAPAS
ncbi:phage tail protein [Govanella unica]|uniref:Phage tail protein n=1 Tax=Govanella unica TaxID=2975056 RepID=A0A9X3TW86_9PROT|nr:phage tail protein [Govania unica]MDA5192803.1 phage tail protein [Govania unica]